MGAITDAATTCKYCVAAHNYVGVGAAVADCPASYAGGTKKYDKAPLKCKCGTGIATFGEYCYANGNGPIAACTNTDGTAISTTACACETSVAGVATLTLANTKLCTAGVTTNVEACVNDGSTSAKLGANAIPCTCGGSTCTAGQICRSTATTKCAAFSPTAAPTAAPTYGAVTIVQKLTMSGAQTAYTGNVKSLAEEAYVKVLGIFDTTLTTPAYKTGCSVTSVASASRRAYAVTFTATTSASTGAAANTAATALTSNIAAFTSAAATVKAAVTAYGTVTAPTATGAAASTTTAVPTPAATVSGASGVTTSIMAMAVAVLAAFQARQ